MYSPDGFASLVCLMYGECWFLSWQAPFVELMHLFRGNILFFFFAYTLLWFALIGSIYFLAKSLKIKHLFLSCLIVLFGCSFFVDNWIGNFENDYFAIVLFFVALTIYFSDNHLFKSLKNWLVVGLIALGSSFWFWFGHLRPIPLIHNIAEYSWLTIFFAWGLLLPLVIYLLWNTINELSKLKFELKQILFFVGLVFPKLWFLCIPLILINVDLFVNKLFNSEMKFIFIFVVIGLLIGSMLRVGLFSWDSWSFESDSNCFLVNREYLMRLKGKSLNYNQSSILEYEECLKREQLMRVVT